MRNTSCMLQEWFQQLTRSDFSVHLCVDVVVPTSFQYRPLELCIFSHTVWERSSRVIAVCVSSVGSTTTIVWRFHAAALKHGMDWWCSDYDEDQFGRMRKTQTTTNNQGEINEKYLPFGIPTTNIGIWCCNLRRTGTVFAFGDWLENENGDEFSQDMIL